MIEGAYPIYTVLGAPPGCIANASGILAEIGLFIITFTEQVAELFEPSLTAHVMVWVPTLKLPLASAPVPVR